MWSNGVSGKRRLLTRFRNGCEKDQTSNQITVVKVEKRSVDVEPEVPTISVIPYGTVDFYKEFYYGVYVMQIFMKDHGVVRKEDQEEMDPYPDEKEMEDVRISNERERHWRMVFDYNEGGVDNQKAIIYSKRWYLYVNG